jgi:hypothetical protein
MQATLLGVGLACVVAAVVGGGLTLAGSTFPIITSVARQILLGLVGAALLTASFLVAGSGSGSAPSPSPPTQTTPGVLPARQPPTFTLPTLPPPEAPAEITLSRSTAPRGAVLTIFGSGFSPGELVEIRVHVTTVATVTADSDGKFTQQITVPPSAPPAGFPTSIAATGHTSVKTATAPFSTV